MRFRALYCLLGFIGSGCTAPQVVPPMGLATEIARGEYLAELLGCQSCHTQGMLTNRVQPQAHLAGSNIGIAFTSYRRGVPPGIVFPRNITPDVESGIGSWSRAEIVRNIRYGVDKNGHQQMPVMPWPGYSHMSKADAGAIASYLMSLPPIHNVVPANVEEGQASEHPYVRYGIYVFESSGEMRRIRQPGTGAP